MTSQQSVGPVKPWHRNRRYWIIAAGAVSLFLLILLSLPYGIQFGLADLLQRYGARQVHIANIDFNPFSGRLLFEGVRADAGNGGELRLERLMLVLGWRDLFVRHARVEAVELQGLTAELDLSDPAWLVVSGLRFPLGPGEEEPGSEAAGDASPWGFALDLVELRDSALRLKRDDLEVELGLARLKLQKVISWQLRQRAALSLRARVNGAPLSAELQGSLFEATREIAGRVELSAFELSSLQPLLSAAGGPELAGRLTLRQELRLALSPEGDADWQTEGNLTIDDLSLGRHQLQAKLTSLRWQGEASLTPRADKTPSLSLQGEGGLEGLSLLDRAGDTPLASLLRLDLTGAVLSADNRFSAAGLRLQGARLDQAPGGEGKPLLESEELSLKGIGFAPGPAGLSIELIEQQGLQTLLALDKDGRLNLLGFAERLRQAALPAPSGNEETPAVTTPAPTLPVRIDRLVLRGENRLDFTDHSVKPPFKLTLDLKEFSLSDIDSSRPARPSPFRFAGSSGRHTKISAEGEITLFQENPSGLIKGLLKGVEMVPLSSYTVPAIGYHLDSGELDAEIDLALQQGSVKGNNHLTIRRLDVTEASEAEAAELEEKIAMPLDSALGMLQDKHQTIDLQLPISGKFSDPNVELGDVINTALGNALKKGAMTYITTALFPYGTMVALLKMAGEEVAAVRLDPVGFEPAGSSLDEQDRDYLDKVALILKERPKIAVKLCGIATQADRRELLRLREAEAGGKKAKKGEEGAAAPPISDEQLLTLAKQRTEAIEDYLVNQHAVNASRTVNCRPTIDPENASLPRVDLQI